MIFISSHSRTASDKVPFEIRAQVICDSGNTDTVYFYQEFTTGLGSITRSVWVIEAAESMWTNCRHVCAQMHICGKPQHTYIHVETIRNRYKYPNTLGVMSVCVVRSGTV